MTTYHSSATCETCMRERMTIARIMEDGDREIAEVTRTMRKGLVESVRACMSEMQRHFHDAEGSTRVIDLACAFLVAFVVLACMTFGHHTEPTVSVHYSTVPASTTTVAPQAPPETTAASPTLPAVATVAKPAPKPATVITEATPAPSGEILANPVVQLSCEVLADGIDARTGDGVAGWYRQSIPSDAADANPSHVRNCTLDADG